MTNATDMRAETFVRARLSAGSVDVFPGEKPASLDEAYAIQDAAIGLWPKPVGGWKVGRITGDYETEHGQDRLVGPVFTELCFHNDKAVHDMPVFSAGFAAVEGEVTAVISRDAPAGQETFTTEEALSYIEALHVGVEVASSPFAEINDHGPLVTIADFGNNYGIILGKEIPDWRDMKLEDWVFETFINGESVGKAAPTGLPGGPVESVRYLLENTSRRGVPLKAGQLVVTGAVTGVHQAFVGDESEVTCCGEKISLRLTGA